MSAAARVLLLVLPAVVSGCVTPTAADRPDLRGAAVDALPYLIDRVWGYDDARPYTVRLTADDHDDEWLRAQVAKPFVLGVCEEESRDCSQGDATMVATIHLVRIERDGTGYVEVTFGRGDERRGGFMTRVALYFAWEDGGWRMVDHRIRWIT